jgi:Sulfotransferase family
VRRLADHVYATRKQNFWGWIARNVERERFVDAILASDRSERAFLELMLAFQAQGRRVRGEKTPANLHHVPTLIAWFPRARIIHTFRDPRAIFASQKRKQLNRGRWWRVGRLPLVGLVIDLYASLRMVLSWRWAARLHARYRRQYPSQYRLVRYEDLVADPPGTIRSVCEFVGIPYSEDMLDQTSRNSSFRSRDEVRGFDTAAVDRWRDVLSPPLQAWFRLWCGRALRSSGYDV